MLQHISTARFIEAIILSAGIYYIIVAAIYYQKEIRALLRKRTEIEPNDRARV